MYQDVDGENAKMYGFAEYSFMKPSPHLVVGYNMHSWMWKEEKEEFKSAEG